MIGDIEEPSGEFTLDMANYTHAADDVILVNVNGISLVEDEDYSLDTSGEQAEILTNYELEAGNTLEIIVLKSKIGQS